MCAPLPLLSISQSVTDLSQGAGEALRGTINSGLDSLAGDKEGVAKNQQVAERGFDSMDDGHLRRQNHAEAAASRKATGKDVSGSDTAHVSRNI